MSKDTIKILNFRNLDFDKLEYYQPNQTNYGSHIGNISYRLTKNNVMPVYIETPKLITTSGIVKIDNKFYMEFEIDLSNNDNPFYDFIAKFDEKNIINCHFNSKSWFNKQIPYNVIEDYYKSPLKLQSSRKNPIFKVRLPSYRGKVLTEIYNQKKELVDISKVDENDQVVGIIGFAGLRFLSQQFVAEWELYKLKLLKDTNSFKMPSGYLFSDLESKETVKTNIEEKSEEVSPPVKDITKEKVSTPVEKKSEEVSTPTEDITEEKVSTPVKDITEEKVSTPVEEKSEEVSTPTEDITEEKVSTPVEEKLEEVSTPTEDITEEKVSTPTEDITEEKVSTPTEDITEEKVSTPTEDITEEKVSTPTEDITEEKVSNPVEEKSEEVLNPVAETSKEVSNPVEETSKEVSNPVKEISKVKHTSPNNYQNISTSEEIVLDIQKENNIKELEEEIGKEELEEESDDEFYDSEFELDDDLLEGVEIIN